MSPKALVSSTASGGVVEHARFRTWESHAAAHARPAWRIIAKYHVLRMARTWWLSTLMVLFGVMILVTLGNLTYDLGRGAGFNHGEVTGAVAMFTWPSIVMALIVGAPLFADDIRFNAPLFYFSRPVERVQYFYGKAAFLGGLMLVLTVVPLVLTFVLLLFTAPLADPGNDVQDVEGWRTRHIDTVGDVLYVMVTQLPAILLLLAFLSSATLMVSSLTRRGWHAALALLAGIGIWGMLGVMASDFSRSAAQNLFGPFGWTYLLVEMPLLLRFVKPREEAQGADSFTLESYEGAGISIAFAYLIVAALTVVFTGIALRRIVRQGDDL